MREIERLKQMEIWIAWVRLLAVPFAFYEVGKTSGDYPHGYETPAWTIAIAIAVGAVIFFWLARRDLGRTARSRVGLVALAFDIAVVYALTFEFVFVRGTPPAGILYLPVIEGALRYGVRGGVAVPLFAGPLLFLSDWWRADQFGPPAFSWFAMSVRFGLQLLIGSVVGWLVDRLRDETRVAELRAAEAEELRDRLARRADLLEAVNRAARALGSSLDLERAFDAFRRELRSIVAYERMEVELADGDRRETIASFGDPDGPEPAETVVSPLTAGDHELGSLSVARIEGPPFTAEEVEMLTLVARQVASAVENMRLYEAERNAAEELRRLSALRADFVSLVSHELRAPMAAVIGCAQTLQRRWRELAPDQRESFLDLIETETSRLADLIGDVLDTSRIEAGTFSYTFEQVDVEELVREAAALVTMGQDEVRVATNVPAALPPVLADRERLRQLLLNLLTNAVKYTVAGDEVEILARSDDGVVAVSVRDHGPGIPLDKHGLVFEKFGRGGGASKPGAGLGLFIARSIAEAHGGTLDVDSRPGSGATFTVRLPLSPQ